MHVQSCCFAYSIFFFFDVLVTVAVAVLASFHANVAQHLVSSFWFSLIIKDVSGYLKIVRK